MIKKKVLIVDDNKEILLSLKEGLEKYDKIFSVLIAGDGIVAIESLKKNSVTLVVADLKMPRMDGLALLTHIMENYPDIPVIIMTGYSTKEMEKLAREKGAVAYIQKPFMVEELASQIIEILGKESEGGTLHSVSSGMFLQLVEMEQQTCTIRLIDNASGKQGALFFRDGELLDARVNDLKGVDAAYEIFSWYKVSLAIQNECIVQNKKIESDLQAILLEAMRLKDEKEEKNEAETLVKEAIPEKVGKVNKLKKLNLIDTIHGKLRNEIGERCGLEDICYNSSWDGLIAQISRIGSFFNTGELKLGYINRDEANDYILMPGKKTTVLLLNPKCPRDRIIKLLSNISYKELS